MRPTIEGTITLPDGSTSRFALFADSDGEYSWLQWGASTDRHGETVELVMAMNTAAQQEAPTYWDDRSDLEASNG